MTKLKYLPCCVVFSETCLESCSIATPGVSHRKQRNQKTKGCVFINIGQLTYTVNKLHVRVVYTKGIYRSPFLSTF